MVVTSPSLLGIPGSPFSFAAKTPAAYPANGLLVEEFDLFVQGYAGKTVIILRAGTTELMPCYSDIFLTESIPNPQILTTYTDSIGNTYGKFLQSVYVPFAYTLDISDSEQTGVRNVPIISLDGADASNAVVTASGTTNSRRLKDHLAAQIELLQFGEISTSAATNTTTLSAAIAAAAANGGGNVLLPPGVINFHSISVPQSVLLVGHGREVTILQSEYAGKVIEFTGGGAGLRGVQVDGVNLLTGSTGLFAKGIDDIILDDVIVRRFQRGILWQGGKNHVYRILYVKNNARNFEWFGDTDLSGTSTGDEISGFDWVQGEISESTEVGLYLNTVDRAVRHCTLSQVDFLDNVGTESAFRVRGASWITAKQCYWDGNEKNLAIADNPDNTIEYNQVSDIVLSGGQMDGGESTFDGLCQNIIFERMELNDCDFVLDVPQNPIIFRDCTENSVLFSGDATKINRVRTINNGRSSGATTDAVATTVWKTEIKPNEVIQLLVSATAERQNGAGYADFLYCCGARCAGSTLNYDSQTANFTVGSSVAGATSGATAIIVADSDAGTTGTLTLAAVIGTFVDNEIIAESSGTGSATVNGSLVRGSAAIIDAATELRASGSDAGGTPPLGWGVSFAALGQEVLVKVTGAASNDVVWNVGVNATIL